MRPFFGGLGAAPSRLASVFVAEPCLADAAVRGALPAGPRYVPVRDSRGLSSADMRRNTATPRVEVPVGPGPVHVDGRAVDVQHAATLPLARLHHLG
jgi:urease subunit alpha